MKKKIMRQIWVVRETGRVNMFDIPGVQRVANDLGLCDLVVFLMEDDGISEYCQFIMTGKATIYEEVQTRAAHD